MNVVVALDQRFEATPDGKVWTPGPFARSFWQRYLDVFDHVQVVARVRRVTAASPGWVRTDGSGVSFIPVTYYLGPLQYLLRRQPDPVRAAERRGAVGRGHPSRGLSGRHRPGAATTSRGTAVRRGGCWRSVRRLCARSGRASASPVLPLVVPPPASPAVCLRLRDCLCHRARPATPISAPAG